MSITLKGLMYGPMRYLPSFLAIAMLAWLTLSPDPMNPPKIFLWDGADKMAHALMFGGLTVMLLSDAFRGRKINALALLAIIATGAVAGAAIEILQREMELGRTADRADFLADAIGVAAASASWLLGRLSR
ncbi:MAG: VanZ family protein [Pseudoflavonifractor sp.]|nr:VanZ family protein [Alloprevotella sp.]MCM1117343.1 VanZ family protein [Pseudoflavonifractor sp.]